MKNATPRYGHYDYSHAAPSLVDSPSLSNMSRLHCLALLTVTVFALEHEQRLAQRSITAIGPYGTCPAPVITVYSTVFDGLGGDATASINVPSETSLTVAPAQEESTIFVRQTSSLKSPAVQSEVSSKGTVSSVPSVGSPSTNSASVSAGSSPTTFIDISVPAGIYSIEAAPTFPSLA
jgi:hypothetical protein